MYIRKGSTPQLHLASYLSGQAGKQGHITRMKTRTVSISVMYSVVL